MGFYIKKDVVAREAKELTQSNREELMEWCSGSRGLDGGIILKTLESNGQTQVAQTGDFIMKGYSEEEGWHFWPIKPGYFHENYKEVPH